MHRERPLSRRPYRRRPIGFHHPLRLEMIATRSDTATLAWLTETPPPTTILVGAKTLLAPRAVARQLGAALDAVNVVVSGVRHMIPITHREAIADCILRDDVPRPAAIARLFGRVNEGRPRCRIRVPADRSWPPVALAPQAALAERCARRRDSSSSFLAFGFAMSS